MINWHSIFTEYIIKRGNKENKYIFLIQLEKLDSYVRIDEKFQLFIRDYKKLFVCEFLSFFLAEVGKHIL